MESEFLSFPQPVNSRLPAATAKSILSISISPSTPEENIVNIENRRTHTPLIIISKFIVERQSVCFQTYPASNGTNKK
ncbi:MAG: hypothetical protein JW913_17315 [Chitinispirillaceae bacterium]|nr:hypothetical protein [Chitinispirillaceae bacterium]